MVVSKGTIFFHQSHTSLQSSNLSFLGVLQYLWLGCFQRAWACRQESSCLLHPMPLERASRPSQGVDRGATFVSGTGLFLKKKWFTLRKSTFSSGDADKRQCSHDSSVYSHSVILLNIQMCDKWLCAVQDGIDNRMGPLGILSWSAHLLPMKIRTMKTMKIRMESQR